MITFHLPLTSIEAIRVRLTKILPTLIVAALTIISVYFFVHYYQNGLGLSYNDARSHLDIGRRVVEGLSQV